jgi:hypothetical protein
MTDFGRILEIYRDNTKIPVENENLRQGTKRERTPTVRKNAMKTVSDKQGN